MAKIRHVVYRAADLEAMANFFVDAFGSLIGPLRRGFSCLSGLCSLPVEFRNDGKAGIHPNMAVFNFNKDLALRLPSDADNPATVLCNLS